MDKLKVLVVDDEKPARETLTYVIDWSTTGFEIAGMCKNGKEALKAYEDLRPDLIITDIQMPVMNGLELIRNIRQKDEKQKFVILSCHENFSYAREAIKMGVTEYLLKDMLTSQDLYSILAKIEQEKKGLEVRPEIDLSIAKDHGCHISPNQILEEIIFDYYSPDEKKIYISKHNLDLGGDYFVLFSVQVDDYKRTIGSSAYPMQEKTKQKLYSGIKAALKDDGVGVAGGECYCSENGEYIVLARLDEICSQQKYISKCHETAWKIQSNIRRACEGVSVTIGISKGFHGLDNIYERYKEALEVTKYRMFAGKGQILFHDTIISRASQGNADILEGRVEKVKWALKGKDIKALSQELNALFCENLKGFMQYNYLSEVNQQLYDLIVLTCNENGIKYEEVFNCSYIPIHQLESLDTVYDISRWFIDVFERIINSNSRTDSKRYSRHVQYAIEYINESYQKNIGLSEIAEDLNLHKVYLSRLFRHETGDTITNYITDVRIRKAKQLMLTTNYKLYEIGLKVGYTNTHQFFVAFKKHMGITPGEFRETNI